MYWADFMIIIGIHDCELCNHESFSESTWFVEEVGEHDVATALVV